MEKRKLGTDGLEVAANGLGCMGMSHGYGPVADKKESIAVIHRAIDLGVTFFDMAEIYDDNELLVGEALALYRNQVVIATKCGIKMSTENRWWMGAQKKSESLQKNRLNA